MMHRSNNDVCQLCGKRVSRLERAHIVDKTADGDGSKVNLLPSACPSCHSTFDNVLKPKLYKALRSGRYGNYPWSGNIR